MSGIEVDTDNVHVSNNVMNREFRALQYMANIYSEKIGNTFLLSDNFDINTNGDTIGGTLMTVKRSRADYETGAHEIGHILGLGHYESGLMTPDSSNPKRSPDVTPAMIHDIIKGANTGVPVGGPGTGKGKIINNASKLINLNESVKQTKKID